MRRSFVSSVFLIAGFYFVLPAAAQHASPNLTLTGSVLDPSRAPIAGARVTVVTSHSRRTVSTQTDERGQFTILIDTRDFVLTVAAKGFATLTETINASTVAVTREFVLQVQGLRESISVNAAAVITGGTRMPAPARDVPQSVTIVTEDAIKDQLMTSIGDVVRYVPGISAHQGENNRDDVIIRGNRSSADFFVNGVRDDVQYYRDLYNVERVEALKGPNALVFGRGGGGGVVNRVTKEAGFQPLLAFTLQAGGFDHKRVTADVNEKVADRAAFRLNGMFERSESFRRGVALERTAVNPTLTVTPGANTRVIVGYEYLRDRRVADRGITSIDGRPAPVDSRTFYGDPDRSHVRADVHVATAVLERQVGRFTLRNRTLAGNYDRFYQNLVPGTPTSDRTRVSLTAYNNAAERTNVFNQLDVLATFVANGVKHTLLVGSEFGRQATGNFRNTGFFNDLTTSIQVPFENPATNASVTFRQSATDANNHVRARVAAVLVQDQAQISERLQVLGGLRADRFTLRYHNNRNGETLARTDNLVSPRLGVVFKPLGSVSTYLSYSISHLPSSGDQFSSLTALTQQLKPERFNNYELGVKWEAPTGLALTAAVYRLDRLNTRSVDPNDPTRIVQTGAQRTKGVELGISGRASNRWNVMGGYAFQDALVTSATAAAAAGAQVAQVPHHMFSLWNSYQLHPRASVAAGLSYRSDMFAGIDNTVTLPGYTRADAAAYFSLTKRWRLQANVENLFDRRYFVNADGNTNISPGSPRVLRAALGMTF
ncbi:MAG: TonB-dependent siderophore receptor [Vicinamibacterales bacterium]